MLLDLSAPRQAPRKLWAIGTSCVALVACALAACSSSSTGKSSSATGGQAGAAGSGASAGSGGSAGVSGSGGSAGASGSAGSAGAGGTTCSSNIGKAPQPVGATVASNPRTLALTETGLYFAGDTPAEGTLEYVAGPGATPTVFKAPGSAFWGVATDGSMYFAADSAQMAIQHEAIGTFPPKQTSVAPAVPYLVAVDATHVYFDDNAKSEIRRFAKAGGKDELVAPNVPGVWNIASDGKHLWATADDDTLRRITKADGSTLPVLVPGALDLRGLAVTASHVYFATWDVTGKCPTNTTSTLYRVGKDGTKLKALTGKVGAITSMAADGCHLYYTEIGTCAWFTDGRLMRIALDTDSPTPEELVKDQGRPMAVAANSKSVFWMNAGSLSGPGAPSVVPAGVQRLDK